ncbi:hypothetical protein HPO96_34140 [Kribbella sandramycini]|uniref:Uncharacterized protein n=1 Tax=Kribbella sandramycini TaxID=60450 RepID=A0A7Y4L8S8_9ACTN|nr:DUF6339 family protein [Kribbella sandramycini]MBB6570441.1 hypothetical protein [Kribbella sandramycini]NOL45301.1 hypothetical protein [Kribbella sandramycini]
MGVLYPRLLAEQARTMHELYRTLEIAELGRRAGMTHDSSIFAAVGGDRAGIDDLAALRLAVVDLATGYGFPAESSRDARRDFDLRVAETLHSGMHMVPAEAAAGDVWAFLALVLLPDVAYWRYPRPPGDRVLATDITRHVFGRLWWRAHLVYSGGEVNPYGALGILGEAAFDQIYARRKALGASPHLVKAILRTWADLDLGDLDEREVLRGFLQRLLRLSPFVVFDALDAETLDAELRVVVLETVDAVRADRPASGRIG